MKIELLLLLPCWSCVKARVDLREDRASVVAPVLVLRQGPVDCDRSQLAVLLNIQFVN